MTIKTLTFIHDLLKEENQTRHNAYHYIRNLANKAVEEEAPNAEYLKKQADDAWLKHIEAVKALDDFEEKEW